MPVPLLISLYACLGFLSKGVVICISVDRSTEGLHERIFSIEKSETVNDITVKVLLPDIREVSIGFSGCGIDHEVVSSCRWERTELLENSVKNSC